MKFHHIGFASDSQRYNMYKSSDVTIAGIFSLPDALLWG